MECHADANKSSFDYDSDSDTKSVMSDFSVVSVGIPPSDEQNESQEQPPHSEEQGGDEPEPECHQEMPNLETVCLVDEDAVAEMKRFRTVFTEKITEMLTTIHGAFDSEDMREFEEMQRTLYEQLKDIVACAGLNAPSEKAIKRLDEKLRLQMKEHKRQLQDMESVAQRFLERLQDEGEIRRKTATDMFALQKRLDEETADRQKTVTFHQEAIGQWNTRATQYRQEISNLKNLLNNSHAAFKTKLCSATEEVRTLRQELRESASDYADELACARGREEETRKSNHELTTALEDAKAKALSETSKHKEDLRRVEASIEAARVAKFDELNKILREQDSKFQVQLDCAGLEIQNLKNENQALSTELKECGRMLADTADRGQHEAETAQYLKEVLVRKDYELGKVNAKYNNALDDAERGYQIQDQLHVSQELCRELTQKLEVLSEKDKEVVQEKEQLRTQVQVCQNHCEDLTAKLLELRNKNTRNENAKSELQIKLQDSQVHCKELTAELAQSSGVKADYDKAVQEKEQLHNQLQHCKDTCKKLTAELFNSAERNQKYGEENQVLAQKLKAYDIHIHKSLQACKTHYESKIQSAVKGNQMLVERIGRLMKQLSIAEKGKQPTCDNDTQLGAEKEANEQNAALKLEKKDQVAESESDKKGDEDKSPLAAEVDRAGGERITFGQLRSQAVERMEALKKMALETMASKTQQVQNQPSVERVVVLEAEVQKYRDLVSRLVKTMQT